MDGPGNVTKSPVWGPPAKARKNPFGDGSKHGKVMGIADNGRQQDAIRGNGRGFCRQNRGTDEVVSSYVANGTARLEAPQDTVGVDLPGNRHRHRRGHRDDGDRAGLLRSEEHTSELQSRQYLVCRLLL